MNKNTIIARAAIHACGAAAYVFLVVFFIQSSFGINLEHDAGIFAPIVILLLLVFSVALMGLLVFGKPIFLYLDGQKKEAVSLVFFTVGFIGVLLLLIVLGIVIF